MLHVPARDVFTYHKYLWGIPDPLHYRKKKKKKKLENPFGGGGYVMHSPTSYFVR